MPSNRGFFWRLTCGSHMAIKPPVLALILEGPDGTRLFTEAELRLHHFRPSGYKLIVYLPALEKAGVPVGSSGWRV